MLHFKHSDSGESRKEENTKASNGQLSHKEMRYLTKDKIWDAITKAELLWI
jgi:hypothetical protein